MRTEVLTTTRYTLPSRILTNLHEFPFRLTVRIDRTDYSTPGTSHREEFSASFKIDHASEKYECDWRAITCISPKYLKNLHDHLANGGLQSAALAQVLDALAGDDEQPYMLRDTLRALQAAFDPGNPLPC